MIDLPQMRSLVDAMIPGYANRWPAASDAIDVASLTRGLGETLPRAALDLIQILGANALAPLREKHPEALKDIMSRLYAAYYTAPAVQGVIRELAESGPREPSPHFDEAMLDRVRGTRAGQRRL